MLLQVTGFVSLGRLDRIVSHVSHFATAHSYVDWHLGWFHILTIVGNTVEAAGVGMFLGHTD